MGSSPRSDGSAQNAAPATAGATSTPEADMRFLLAQQMQPQQQLTPQQQAAMRIAALPGGQGTYAGMGGGASYTGSSAMRR